MFVLELTQSRKLCIFTKRLRIYLDMPREWTSNSDEFVNYLPGKERSKGVWINLESGRRLLTDIQFYNGFR